MVDLNRVAEDEDEDEDEEEEEEEKEDEKEVHGDPNWWARQDLNLQGFPHVVLSHARLPFRHSPELHGWSYRQFFFSIKSAPTKPKSAHGFCGCARK